MARNNRNAASDRPAAADSTPAPEAASVEPQAAEDSAAAAPDTPPVAEVAASESQVDQDAALRDAGIKLPEDPRVYRVEIGRCLLGEKFVLAHSEQEALTKYKAVCGITAHREPAQVRVTNLDPEKLPKGVELFGD